MPPLEGDWVTDLIQHAEELRRRDEDPEDDEEDPVYTDPNGLPRSVDPRGHIKTF